nr:hypothetical protein [Novosphingobium sp. PASSN1]
MRTRLSICLRKARFTVREQAEAAARASGLVLHPYRCDRCWQWHLTSRTKGRRRLPASAPHPCGAPCPQ